jgi:glucose/arabinose dehydrogenase
MRRLARAVCAALIILQACGGGGAATSATQQSPTPGAVIPISTACMRSSSAPTPKPAGPSPQPAASLRVPPGFRIETIANVPGARELAFSPNGDLIVGTTGSAVYLVANAEDQPGFAHVFVKMNDSPAAGVAMSLKNCSLYVGTQSGVYRIPYAVGDQTAQSPPVKIAAVRASGGGDHVTTSVAVSGSRLYASVGSSCNACTETDPTRATIQQMRLDGSGMTAKAIHIRNAIALTTNPSTGAVWAGDAGQDYLPEGHPYEFFDPVTLHTGQADYGWPGCEENRIAYRPGADCSNTVVPRVVFPAYETIVGAAFYAAASTARYVFPPQYRNGAFVVMHGSWHANGARVPVAAPRVAFVAMSGDVPARPVNWESAAAQSTDFVTGFQRSDGARAGRPTGVAVGPLGDVFLADDQAGAIYRIRP